MKYIDFDPASKQRLAIIDGDGIAWAIGWNHKESILEGPMLAEVDLFMHDTLQGTQSANYAGILSPNIPANLAYEPNFRKAIAKSREYKGHRKDKPEWYLEKCPIIEDHLVNQWGFIRTPQSFEADDLCATLHRLLWAGNKVITVHTDKDLNQLQGEHFNPVKKMIYQVTIEEAYYNLYNQIICGDTTDNIQGIPGWGPKAAEVALAPRTSAPEENYFGRCMQAYLQAYSPNCDIALQQFYENYMLCKLRQDIDLDLLTEDPLHGYDLDAN